MACLQPNLSALLTYANVNFLAATNFKKFYYQLWIKNYRLNFSKFNRSKNLKVAVILKLTVKSLYIRVLGCGNLNSQSGRKSPF